MARAKIVGESRKAVIRVHLKLTDAMWLLEYMPYEHPLTTELENAVADVLDDQKKKEE